MLKYLHQKAKSEGIKIETIKADLICFKLKKKVDLAFIMMGIIGYVDGNYKFSIYLDSVADAEGYYAEN